jgi:DNA-binding PadR family transcriptional regulator
MAWKKTKGTNLQVFSGKEARLNRVISKILENKGPLIAYDVVLQLRGIKGFRHIDSKIVYRHMEALEKQGWIAQTGTRQSQPGWDSTLHELTLRGKAALILDETNIDAFLQTATKEQLLKLINSFS